MGIDHEGEGCMGGAHQVGEVKPGLLQVEVGIGRVSVFKIKVCLVHNWGRSE